MNKHKTGKSSQLTASVSPAPQMANTTTDFDVNSEKSVQQVTQRDVEDFLLNLRQLEMQKLILENLKSVEYQDDNAQIAGHQVPVSDGVKKALQDLSQVEPTESDNPYFSVQQITESKHYDESEGFDVTMQIRAYQDILNVESLAWLCFSVQRAIYEPDLADGVQLRALGFKTIFDNVQFLKLESTNVQEGVIEVKIFFYWVKRFVSKLKQDSQREAQRLIQQQQEQQELQRQQAQKNAIVEHVRQMMEERENSEFVSNIRRYSLQAQAGYKTHSMKDIAMSGTYTGAPKYLKQRDQPLEIPIDCIRRLADVVDKTFDERCSLQELRDYVKLKELPFEEGAVDRMFEDAIRGRGYITEEQRTGPLRHDEIAAAVRGRHQWNVHTKEWEIQYRPYRDYWIVLLLTVNKKIFALPTPKIVPSRIKAQYEIEEEYQKTIASLPARTMSPVQPQKFYESVTEIYQPSYKRVLNKNEANIKPETDFESTIRIKKEQEKKQEEQSAFATQINQRIVSQEHQQFPKVTFNAREMYDQAYDLSLKIPFWRNQAENPINQFVPNTEQPFQTRSDETLKKLTEERLMRYTQLQNKERTLQLAGTESLKKREMSPLSKLRQTRGLITLKRVPDNFEVRNEQAKKEYKKLGFQYEQPQEPVFRVTDPGVVLKFGQTDFDLETRHPPAIPNPNGISVHNPLPKFLNDRERKLKDKQTEADGLKDKETWHAYHKILPMKHVPLAQELPDKLVKKEKDAFLEREKWESAYILLSRTINDNQIVGKAPVQKYFQTMKPEHKNKAFDGTFQDLKVIV